MRRKATFGAYLEAAKVVEKQARLARDEGFKKLAKRLFVLGELLRDEGAEILHDKTWPRPCPICGATPDAPREGDQG